MGGHLQVLYTEKVSQLVFPFPEDNINDNVQVSKNINLDTFSVFFFFFQKLVDHAIENVTQRTCLTTKIT